jgi:hypothetical protein
VLAECLAALQSGDTLVIWRLDRLGRSLPHLLQVVEDLGNRGVGFESLHDRVDTTSATGRLVFHIMAALSQFERDLTRERILAGLEAARARGQKLGPRTKLTRRSAGRSRTCCSAGFRGRRSRGRWGSAGQRCTATSARSRRVPAESWSAAAAPLAASGRGPCHDRLLSVLRTLEAGARLGAAVRAPWSLAPVRRATDGCPRARTGGHRSSAQWVCRQTDSIGGED